MEEHQSTEPFMASRGGVDVLLELGLLDSRISQKLGLLDSAMPFELIVVCDSISKLRSDCYGLLKKGFYRQLIL